MRPLLLLLASLAFAAPAAAAAQDPEQRVAWNRPAEPFRILENVYSVGTEGLAAYLIADETGHVLIDGALPESAGLIADNVRALGFRIEDVRLLLVNHGHFDHAGGLAELKRRSGAALVASEGDRADLEAGETAGRPELDPFPAVAVDRVVADGETLRVGDAALTAYLTPGHTRGCTSWLLESGGRRILFACSLTVAGQNLIDDPAYPAAAEDFRRTFARLREIEADVFLNFHPGFFGLDAKRAAQRAGDADAFVDPGELARQVDRAERMFEEELERQRARR